MSKVGSDIPKDDRFHYEKKKMVIFQQSPGPGAYESKTAFVNSGQKPNGLGKITRFQEKSIDYSVEKDFISKDTPGPGMYQFNDHFKKGKY
jgi:hypothetical protein